MNIDPCGSHAIANEYVIECPSGDEAVSGHAVITHEHPANEMALDAVGAQLD